MYKAEAVVQVTLMRDMQLKLYNIICALAQCTDVMNI